MLENIQQKHCEPSIPNYHRTGTFHIKNNEKSNHHNLFASMHSKKAASTIFSSISGDPAERPIRNQLFGNLHMNFADPHPFNIDPSPVADDKLVEGEDAFRTEEKVYRRTSLRKANKNPARSIGGSEDEEDLSHVEQSIEKSIRSLLADDDLDSITIKTNSPSLKKGAHQKGEQSAKKKKKESPGYDLEKAFCDDEKSTLLLSLEMEGNERSRGDSLSMRNIQQIREDALLPSSSRDINASPCANNELKMTPAQQRRLQVELDRQFMESFGSVNDKSFGLSPLYGSKMSHR
jgi:hypothetical protein